VAAALYLPMAQRVYAVLSGPRPATASIATPKWAVREAVRGLRIGVGAVGIAAALALVGLGGLDYLRKKPLVAFVFTLPGALGLGVMIVAGMSIRPRFFFSLLGFGVLMLVHGAMTAGDLVSRSLFGAGSRRRLGVAFVGAIAIVSAYSLRRNYELPKQDYDGARQFVEQHRAATDSVATAGLAIFPYSDYYRLPWVPVRVAQQFDGLRESASRTWVVYSFEEYMDAGLVDQLHRHCPVQQNFPGTLGGGSIIVCAAAGSSR